MFIQSALLYSNLCVTSTNNERSGVLDVDDGSTIYLPFYHCITVCITVCWCCRVLVMPVLLLLIVSVINGYCYSVFIVGLHVSRASCLLLTLYCTCVYYYYYTASGVRVYSSMRWV